MRLPWILLAVLLALGIVVATLYGTPETAHQRGMPHPDHASMALGGSGEHRHQNVLALGFVFAALQVAFFVGLLLLGLRRGDGSTPGRGAILLGGVAYLLVLGGLFRSYRRFMTSETYDLFLGFPHPTAWMLYGVWGVPLVFLLLYVVCFDRWIWNAQSRERFERLVAERGPEKR